MVDLIIKQESFSKLKLVTRDKDLLLKIFNYFSYYVEGYKFQPAYKRGMWDGKIKLFNFVEKLLPIGLLSQLEEFLDSINITYTREFYEDDEFTVTPAYIDNFITKLNIPFEVRDYQKDLVLHAINNRNMVGVAATSSGKSLSIYIITMIMLANKKKVFMIVPSVGLVHQMRSDFISYGLPEHKADELIHIIYAGQEKTFKTSVVITTWQSVFKPAILKEFTSKINATDSQYDCIICDEAHLVKAGDGSKIMDIIEAFDHSPWKIGVTGSLPKNELTKQQITAALGEPVHIIKASELVEMGYATDLNVTAIFLEYNDIERKYIRSSEVKKNWNNEASFFNEHPEKMKFILNLVKSKMKKKENCIVFFKHVSFGKKLFKEIQALGIADHVHYIDGSVDGKLRDTIRGEIDSSESTVLVASYKTTSTGINIKSLNTGIFAESPGKSDTTLVQSLGRFLRQHKSKTVANIYDIVDDCRHGKYENFMYRHFAQRLETYRDQEWFINETRYPL